MTKHKTLHTEITCSECGEQIEIEVKLEWQEGLGTNYWTIYDYEIERAPCGHVMSHNKVMSILQERDWATDIEEDEDEWIGMRYE